MTPLDTILVELDRCDRRAERLLAVQAHNEEVRSALRVAYDHLRRRLPSAQRAPGAGPDLERFPIAGNRKGFPRG